MQVGASLAGSLVLHAAHAVVPAPPALPDLHVLLTCIYSAAHFACFLAYFNYRQHRLPADAPAKPKAE